jgi:hypothetical protein
MPVEITLPLSPAMQSVADARENVRKLGYKVEELKTSLKAAKGAWEEAVEDLNLKLDEMIEHERTPNLFSGLDDDAGKDSGAGAGRPDEPGPNAPAGEPVTAAEVVIISPAPRSGNPNDPFDAPAAEPLTLTAGPAWRAGPVHDHLDGPPVLFDALATRNVETLGDLADALLRGETFGLLLGEVFELQEVIEAVSESDDVPIKFAKASEAASELLGEPAEEQEGEPVDQPDLFTPAAEEAASPAAPAVPFDPFSIDCPMCESPAGETCKTVKGRTKALCIARQHPAAEPATEPATEPAPEPAAEPLKNRRAKKKLTDADLAGL